jgi:putative glutamine amidotransferase
MRLADIIGATDLPVNSMHHQALKEVAPGLAVVARAPDQVIEAVEAPAHPFAIGVQWHPEELAPKDARAQRLFDAFVEACRL